MICIRSTYMQKRYLHQCGLIADPNSIYLHKSYMHPHPYLLLHNYILLTAHALPCAGSGGWMCAGQGTGGPAFLKLEA